MRRAATRPAGGFLVGDAAAVLAPTSSRGVLKALTTVIMAVHSVRLIVGGADERLVADSYRAWVHAGFELDVAELEKLYAVFRGPADSAQE